MKTIGWTWMLALASLAGAATLPYQGLATDAKGNPRTDGTGHASFSIYAASVGGSAVWSEVQSISTRKGLFSTTLGSTNAIPDSLFDGRPLWLGVALDEGAEASPRLRLGNVPFANGSRRALQADSAAKVAGLADSVRALRAVLSNQAQSLSALTARDSVRASHLSDSAKVAVGMADSVAALRSALASVGKGASIAPGAYAGDLLSWDGSNWIAKKLVVGWSSTPGTAFSIVPPFQVVNFVIASSGLFPTRDGEDPYLGEIMMTGFDFVPMGYVACNGQLLNVTQYQALYALLGNKFGGNGASTFGVPDLRGRFPMGAGTNTPAGLTPRTLGAVGGSETRSLTTGNLPTPVLQLTAP